MGKGRYAIVNARYRKSSHSGANNNCVTVAMAGGLAGVQDSKLPAALRVANTLIVPATALRALLCHAKTGRFDS